MNHVHRIQKLTAAGSIGYAATSGGASHDRTLQAPVSTRVLVPRSC